MKKLLTIACVALSSTVFAQEEAAESYVNPFPVKGTVTTEVALNLFGDNNTIGFNSYTNGVKARYFINTNMAIRFGFGINGTNQTNYVSPGVFPGSDTLPTGSQELKVSEIILTPGFEYHFNRKGKISPYVGIDFIYSKKSASEKLDNAQMQQNFGFFPPTPPTDWMLVYSQKYKSESDNGTTTGVRSGTTTGIRLLAGMDYYVAHGFYVGTEFGFDLTSTKTEDYTQKIDYYDWQVQDIKTRTTTTPGNKANNSKATILKGIRIGFTF